MTDPLDAISDEKERKERKVEFADGAVTLDWAPEEGGKVYLEARAGDTVLEAKTASKKIFGNGTLRGAFINDVADAAGSIEANIDVDVLEADLSQWFADTHAIIRDTPSAILPEVARDILEATEYPVRRYKSEHSEWKITLTMEGQRGELTFDAHEMVNGGANALNVRLANEFNIPPAVAKEEWEQIRDRWMEDSEVVHRDEETTKDVLVKEILRAMGRNLLPVDNKETMRENYANVWYDTENVTGYKDADAGEAIAWVQDEFLVEMIKTAGFDVGEKPTYVLHMIERDDLHGGSMLKSWSGKKGREPMYPFVPESLNISEDDVVGGESPAHSEVGV